MTSEQKNQLKNRLIDEANKPEVLEAFRWCCNNGVQIYPIPTDNYGNYLRIAVNIKGKETIGNEIYDKYNAGLKRLELFKNIYNKNHKNK